MSKSRDAFRTISEVAEWLDSPAHVLRFWESKFPQVKPVKRAGGRRYYRPQDMRLLGGIKTLLHDDGMTIKGAQKTLREKGVKAVSAMSAPLPGEGPADQDTGDLVQARVVLPPEQPRTAKPEMAKPVVALAEQADSGVVSDVDDAAAVADQPDAAVDTKPTTPSQTPMEVIAGAITESSKIETDTPPHIPDAQPVKTDVPSEPAALPSFLSKRPVSDTKTDIDQGTADPHPEQEGEPTPQKRRVDISLDVMEPDLAPSVLHDLIQKKPGALHADAATYAPLLARLKDLHTRMKSA